MGSIDTKKPTQTPAATHMSHPKKTPASIRYVKAWLRTLSRPGFWVSTTVLGLVVIFTWQLWLNPDWIKNPGDGVADKKTKEQAPDQPLSPEDVAAIGVDIDNLLAFGQEFTRNRASSNKQKPAVPKPEGFYDQIIRQQAEAAKAQAGAQNSRSLLVQSSSNPFVSSAQNSLSTNLIPNTSNGSSTFTGIASMNRESTAPGTSLPGLNLNPGNSTQLVESVGPLQTILNQQNSASSAAQTRQPTAGSGQNLSTSTPSNSGFPNSAGQLPSSGSYTNTTVQPPTGYSTTIQPPTSGYPSSTGYTPNINSAPNPYSYPSQPQSVPVAPVPQAVPIAPVAPSSYGQYSTQVPSQTPGFNTAPGFNSTLNNPPATQPSQLNQRAFTVPNRTPGRNIGGGQINTFSNP